MGKKKRKKQKQKHRSKPLSDKGYLKKGMARKLPIHECLVPEGWEEIMKFPVIVARRHKSGNITMANVLVDLWCTGAKDAFYMVNIPEYEYRAIIEKFTLVNLNMVPSDYDLVHNIVFRAVEYADKYGIEPYKEFNLAKLVLEKDDGHIPQMEIPLGEKGQPFLMMHPDDSRNSYYYRQLEKNAGVGNFEFVSGDYAS